MGKNTQERQDFIIGNLRADMEKIKVTEMEEMSLETT